MNEKSYEFQKKSFVDLALLVRKKIELEKSLKKFGIFLDPDAEPLKDLIDTISNSLLSILGLHRITICTKSASPYNIESYIDMWADNDDNSVISAEQWKTLMKKMQEKDTNVEQLAANIFDSLVLNHNADLIENEKNMKFQYISASSIWPSEKNNHDYGEIDGLVRGYNVEFKRTTDGLVDWLGTTWISGTPEFNFLNNSYKSYLSDFNLKLTGRICFRGYGAKEFDHNKCKTLITKIPDETAKRLYENLHKRKCDFRDESICF